MRASVAGFVSLLFLAGAARAETVWFVVAEHPQTIYGDSFLLPLTDPADIAQARLRVARGDASGVGSIVTASIAPGSDGLNRNLTGDQRLWSWHVTDFAGFADLAIELCDGWPTYVEGDVAGWIANTGGRVCFWSYAVVAEVAVTPGYAIHGGLDGAWYNPAAPGQGLMIDVLEAQGQVFAGWFTYDFRNGSAAGDPFWITAQGPYSATPGPTVLTVTSTTGGAFNGPRPVDQRTIGSLTVEFTDCNHGTASYALDGGIRGEMPIERIVPLARCTD